VTLLDLDRWLSVPRAVQIRIPFSDGLMDAFVRVYARQRSTGAYHLAEWTPDGWIPRAPAPRDHVLDWLERGSARPVPLDREAIAEAQALERALDELPTTPRRRRRR
jgi:hypothetical protein